MSVFVAGVVTACVIGAVGVVVLGLLAAQMVVASRAVRENRAFETEVERAKRRSAEAADPRFPPRPPPTSAPSSGERRWSP